MESVSSAARAKKKNSPSEDGRKDKKLSRSSSYKNHHHHSRLAHLNGRRQRELQCFMLHLYGHCDEAGIHIH